MTEETGGLNWEVAAEETLSSLVAMVPETVRELAEVTARDEAEGAASERGDSSVMVEDVIRGWIRITPPEQRDGLVGVIDELGFDPAAYAEELESGEGWEDEGSEDP